MGHALLKLFETVSGWHLPVTFGRENYGFVTFEMNPKTRQKDAFFWAADGDPEPLRQMRLGGHTFVRK